MAAVSAQSRSKSKARRSRRARRRSPRPRGCISAFSTRAGAGQAAVRLVRALARSADDAPHARRGPTPSRRAGPSASAACAISAASPQAPGVPTAYRSGSRRRSRRMRDLGSGTQLALAVGSAFAALEDLRLDAQEIARKARARRPIRHRHRHLRPRRRRARQRPAPGRAAAARQPPPLPRRNGACCCIFDSELERARRGERDGRLRHAPRLSGERGRRAASADH